MLVAQGRMTILSTLQYQRNFGLLEYNDMFEIYDAMVTPVLCYAAEIWGHSYLEHIETVQAMFLQNISRFDKKC